MSRLLAAILMILFFIQCSEIKEPLPANQRMEWWDNARFGMFIHWGLYSIPGGIWNNKKIEELGEWIMAYADILGEDYEKLAAQFNPEKFDARQWVRFAKDAGMKYIIITTKHHDGFCLFDSKYTEWDVVDATPFNRDIVKELKEECEKAGIKFGVYYSILEWHHPAMELNTNYKDLEPFSDQAIEGGPFTHIDSTWRKYGNVKMKEGRKEEYISYMKAQLKELIEKYDPAIIWFDGGWVHWWTPQDGKELLDYLWSLKPSLIFNNRAGEDFKNDTWYGDYGTPEQSIPLDGLDYRWESCMTMNSTWGYKSYDHNWKSSRLLITQLVDIIAKGGNFLLNVGPQPDGSFPNESVGRLKEIGNWMDVNGEYVYGSKMWKRWKEGNQSMEEELYDTTEVDAVHFPFTAEDIRFTTKGNIVYAAFLDWSTEDFKIVSMGKEKLPERNISEVEMLGSDEKLTWAQEDEFLKITPPKEKPCKYVYVVKVLLEK